MKYIITFAGPVGSSKTPIANYLSCQFNLPIFNNDTVRTEVVEDLGEFNEEEFRKRVLSRVEKLFQSETSFIFDASIDREWKNYCQKTQESKFRTFIINLDFSKDLLKKIYAAKGYQESLPRLDQLMVDHQEFLIEFNSIVNLRLTDIDFPDRLVLSENALKSWLTIQKNNNGF
ncbi:MAG: hypothetical protein UU09_C0009G0004 [Microgenomates group bacterium GW2011_GWA2_40_6]|nr:MAG: hypothetical protein UU09_C0009G0004 [Microgenomates group bacterium GW2011_GWA2_40_6]HCC29090.1 hypothetical protein [Marinilabiliales bacterium]